MAVIKAIAVWRWVLDALENERCLDLRYREQAEASTFSAWTPNYKVMKQLALMNRLGVLYGPFIGVVVFCIPLLAILQWLKGIVVCIFGKSDHATAQCHVVATTPANIGLIKAALSDANLVGEAFADTDLLQPNALESRIGLLGVVQSIAAHLRLLAHILVCGGTKRIDLLLHSRDAFSLAMLVGYVRMHSAHIFVTDDHYQRWAYLLSHHSRQLVLVQHGFVDADIRFEHQFGRITDLRVRDESFVSYFARYFEVQKWTVFSPCRSLDDHPLKGGILLASSFPSIDAEIELVNAVRVQTDAPIMVKFHPAHDYDGRKELLASLASAVVTGAGFPACKVFVSHSSFMEFDYRALNVPTVSIARAGGTRQAASLILTVLGRDCSRYSSLNRTND